MQLKYGPSVKPISSSRQGFTFMRNPVGKSALTKSSQRRYRSVAQFEIMNLFTYLNKLWRSLPAGIIANWQSWVNFAPQSTRKDSLKFMAPFQNFVKRNYYRLLFYHDPDQLILQPELVLYEPDPCMAKAVSDNGSIELQLTFDRGIGDLELSLSAMPDNFNSTNNPRSLTRQVLSTINVDANYDVTEFFIKSKNTVPEINSTIILKIISCGINNGQFLPIQLLKIKVTAPVGLGFGALYSYAASQHPLIAPAGWRLINFFELSPWFISLFGQASPPADQLRTLDKSKWSPACPNPLNSIGFNAFGSGQRRDDGLFFDMLYVMHMWMSDVGFPISSGNFLIFGESNASGGNVGNYLKGASLRFFKPIADYTTGEIVTDFDGNQYQTASAGTWAFTTSNWKCTHLTDGTPIPEVKEQSTWVVPNEIKMCYYNNDKKNA